MSSNQQKNFLKKNFRYTQVSKKEGLLTGYYLPTINVSYERNKIFNIPILKYNPKFKNIPRKEIQKKYKPDDVLIWTDNVVNLFFLQIQGSGIGVLPNNQEIMLVYDGNNNLEYSSIGKLMIKKNWLKKKEVSLFTIKDWLINNPKELNNVLNYNKRYIFFKIDRKTVKATAKGALGTILEPNVSIAIDKSFYPLGIPFLLNIKEDQTVLPVLGVDTGNAIKGPNRVDLFLGSNKSSEKIAGNLKKKIYLFALIPYIKNHE
ncbi:MAG: hypothetical protein CMM99_01480 [Rickettsiales bacterium]|nr:hypothetical protein [Rickettsiales bacterium]